MSMRSNKYLNDSELESQMDDFMITDSSQGSDNTSQRLEYASFSSCGEHEQLLSEGSAGRVESLDPEAKII